jgi:hypothetical protein
MVFYATALGEHISMRVRHTAEREDRR